MLVEKTDKNRLLVPKFFEYLGINNRVVIGKKYVYIKSRTHILCVCVCVCTFFCLQSVWVPNFISKVKKFSRSFCRSLHVFSTIYFFFFWTSRFVRFESSSPEWIWTLFLEVFMFNLRTVEKKTIKRFSWIDTVFER